MTLDKTTLAKICIAMRNGEELELKQGNLRLLVSEGGGRWRQSMICGAVVLGPGYMARKWCRSVDELQEFLRRF